MAFDSASTRSPSTRVGMPASGLTRDVAGRPRARDGHLAALVVQAELGEQEPHLERIRRDRVVVQREHALPRLHQAGNQPLGAARVILVLGELGAQAGLLVAGARSAGRRRRAARRRPPASACRGRRSRGPATRPARPGRADGGRAGRGPRVTRPRTSGSTPKQRPRNATDATDAPAPREQQSVADPDAGAGRGFLGQHADPDEGELRDQCGQHADDRPAAADRRRPDVDQHDEHRPQRGGEQEVDDLRGRRPPSRSGIAELTAMKLKRKLGIAREPSRCSRRGKDMSSLSARRSGRHEASGDRRLTPCGGSAVQQLGDGRSPQAEVGRQVGQRAQHELALVGPRVRQRQLGAVALLAPSYQSRSRSSVRGPQRTSRSRPIRGLDREQCRQQRVGIELGVAARPRRSGTAAGRCSRPGRSRTPARRPATRPSACSRLHRGAASRRASPRFAPSPT